MHPGSNFSSSRISLIVGGGFDVVAGCGLAVILVVSGRGDGPVPGVGDVAAGLADDDGGHLVEGGPVPGDGDVAADLADDDGGHLVEGVVDPGFVIDGGGV